MPCDKRRITDRGINAINARMIKPLHAELLAYAIQTHQHACTYRCAHKPQPVFVRYKHRFYYQIHCHEMRHTNHREHPFIRAKKSSARGLRPVRRQALIRQKREHEFGERVEFRRILFIERNYHYIEEQCNRDRNLKKQRFRNDKREKNGAESTTGESNEVNIPPLRCSHTIFRFFSVHVLWNYLLYTRIPLLCFCEHAALDVLLCKPSYFFSLANGSPLRTPSSSARNALSSSPCKLYAINATRYSS